MPISDSTLQPLLALAPNRPRRFADARRDMAEIIESDLRIEGFKLTWGQIRVLADGGNLVDDNEVRRARQIAFHARSAHSMIQVFTPPRIRKADRADLLRNVFELAADEFRKGSNQTHVRHRIGVMLVLRGYPWLWVPYKRANEWPGVVEAAIKGDPEPLAELLISNLE